MQLTHLMLNSAALNPSLFQGVSLIKKNWPDVAAVCMSKRQAEEGTKELGITRYIATLPPRLTQITQKEPETRTHRVIM